MVCTSSSSSDSSPSSSSDSDWESEVDANEKEFSSTTQALEKGGEKSEEKGSFIKKADSEIGKRTRSKEGKKQEGKKKREEKSVRVLRKAISKQKEAQQKVNKKLAFALKQVGIERRRQISEINKLKKKKKV